MSHSLHLLAIDSKGLSEELRAALRLDAAELATLLREAPRDDGCELALVTGPDRLELYATGVCRVVAIRSVLRTLTRRGHNLNGFGAARVFEASGPAAAGYAFRSAAGLDDEPRQGQRRLVDLGEAAIHAVEAGMLGEHLSLLFSHATEAAWRVRRETDFYAAAANPASREVEALAVERIVEEQLVSWRSAYPTQSHSPSERPSLEPTSMVRLRAAHTLRPLSSGKSA
jgi:glutamyl-tRNA reductase